ncbi:MAG: UbiA family prenyltransferase [Kutzneria sp.]|nr:UbiA family prenyltransferase [Kutzneria sp.]
MWYPGLVGLAGAALPDGPHPLWPMAAAWLVPTLGWVSAHYWGDYFDRHLDAIDKPQRPIPSGRLSPRAAVVSGSVCAAVALGVVVVTDWRAVVLLVGALAGAVAYSRWLKASGIAGNLARGTLGLLAFLFGTLMTAPYPPAWAVPFALVFLVHDTASNLVGAVRDVDGDRTGGYRTVPVRRGPVVAASIACSLYVASMVLAFGVMWSLPPYAAGMPLLLFAIACGAGAFVVLFSRQGPSCPTVALRAHSILVVERLVLAGAVLAGGVGFLPAAAVLVPALAVSVLTQATMRERHEFPTGLDAPGRAGLPDPSTPDPSPVAESGRRG